MEVEVGFVHRLESRDEDGEIIRQAPGHDGIDSGRVHGELQARGRMGGDHGFRRPALEREHRVDAIKHRRDDRQAIGPSLFKTIIDGGEQRSSGTSWMRSEVKGHGRRPERMCEGGPSCDESPNGAN